MLVNVAPPTNDFHAIARYLVHGRAGTKPRADRVAWTLSHNLPTGDPDLAATYMAATAEFSRRTRKAAYHAMIAWHPDEKPTPEVMQAIAAETLRLAGLEEHQALIMGHGDKPHAHLHMLINRVHPVTGNAWDTAHDYRRFDAIMRQLSEAHGFLHVPAHRFNLSLTDDDERQPGKRATYAARRGASTARPQWSKAASREFGERVSAELTSPTGWEDVERAVRREGQLLDSKGQGLIVGNDRSYAKFSALRLKCSVKDLERMFGESFSDYRARRPVFTVDAVDVARGLRALGLADQGDVQKAVQDARTARHDVLARSSLAHRVVRELQEVLRASTALQPTSNTIPSTPKPRATAQRGPFAGRER